MLKDTIDFYFFSGTGNTLLVVNRIGEVFEKNGKQVNRYRLEKSIPSKINLNNTIGLAFPVAAQGTYRFVWDFIFELPNARGTPIFMVDTLDFFSGGIVGPAKNVLLNKGYLPIGAKEIKMPNNLFPREKISHANNGKVQKGLREAEIYATNLLAGRSQWPRVPIISDFFSYGSRLKISWALMRTLFNFKVDKEKCIECGLCQKLCPVNNIKLSPYPSYYRKCEVCMRCISFCPEEAIYVDRNNYDLYTAIKPKKLLRHKGNA